MPHSLLLTADADTVQDYFLTRSMMRFSRAAPPEEWKFEHQEVRLASGPLWTESHAFLFDYTIARIVIAADRQPTRHPHEPASFVDHFLDAIRSSAGKSARRLWAAHQAEHRSAPDATTVALVALLLAPPALEHRASLLQRLPPPYRP